MTKERNTCIPFFAMTPVTIILQNVMLFFNIRPRLTTVYIYDIVFHHFHAWREPTHERTASREQLARIARHSLSRRLIS